MRNRVGAPQGLVGVDHPSQLAEGLPSAPSGLQVGARDELVFSDRRSEGSA